MIAYPHEVGHLLDLSTKGAGPGPGHDCGPWPQVWEAEKKVGLMYNREVDEMTHWICRQDWFHAYQTAKSLTLVL